MHRPTLGSTAPRALIGLFAAAAALAVSTTVFVQPAGSDWRQPSGREWQVYGGDWGNTRYSTLARITTTNVGTGEDVWSYKPDPPQATRAPTYANGVVVVGITRILVSVAIAFAVCRVPGALSSSDADTRERSYP